MARRLYWETIAGPLGHSPEREAMAASWAARLGGDPCGVLEYLFDRVPGRRVCVLGPLYSGGVGPCDLRVAPEGVPELGLSYDVVAGDLDSAVDPYTLSYHARILLVHVHGDNYTRLASNLDPWPVHARVAFTSQAYCCWPVLGVGGFTDGDRLAVLSMILGAGEIIVAGFDFERPACGHKRACSPGGLEAKARKLQASRSLLYRAAEAYGYDTPDDGDPVGAGIRFIRGAGEGLGYG